MGALPMINRSHTGGKLPLRKMEASQVDQQTNLGERHIKRYSLRYVIMPNCGVMVRGFCWTLLDAMQSDPDPFYIKS